MIRAFKFPRKFVRRCQVAEGFRFQIERLQEGGFSVSACVKRRLEGLRFARLTSIARQSSDNPAKPANAVGTISSLIVEFPDRRATQLLHNNCWTKMERTGMVMINSIVCKSCALKVASIARLTFLASGIRRKKTVDTCLPVCLSTIYLLPIRANLRDCVDIAVLVSRYARNLKVATTERRTNGEKPRLLRGRSGNRDRKLLMIGN